MASLTYVPFGSRLLKVTSPLLSGTDVRVLQVIFNEMLTIMNPVGGPLGPALAQDGIYGPKTAGAVRSVQRHFGLSVDGVAGPYTYRAFGQDVGSFVTYGGPALGSRTLEEGAEGGDVKAMQNRLNCFRYAVALETPADGVFGPRTLQAVRQFQADARANGDTEVGVDGVVGPKTLDALSYYTYTGSRNLSEGEGGFDAAWLQYYLANTTNPGTGQPFYTGRVDGLYGPITRGAVAAFQATTGISNDGIAGPITYHQVGLHNQLAAPRPAPVPSL